MAGNWIKIEHITPDKPEIVRMAEALQIDQDAVLGKCLRLWIWADQQTISGDDLIVTPAFLDRLTNCAGFSNGLLQVGWLKSRNGRFSLPHFDRHNGQTAKNRALSADRMKRQRYAPIVTETSPELELEKELKPPLSPKGGKRTRKVFQKPTREEVAAYCAARGNGIDPNYWYDSQEARGWLVGKNRTPMQDWQAVIRTWEQNRKDDAPKGSAPSGLQPDFILTGGSP